LFHFEFLEVNFRGEKAAILWWATGSALPRYATGGTQEKRPIPPLITTAFHSLHYGSIRGISSDKKIIHLPCVATLRTGAGNLTQAYADVTSR